MPALISGMIPFAGGSYLAYSLLDNSIANPPGDQLTPVYMFVSGCLAASVAKVMFFRDQHRCTIFLFETVI